MLGLSFLTPTEIEVRIEPLSKNDVVAQEHADALIVEAILARDGARAATLMRKHLAATGETLWAKGRLEQPLIPQSFWQAPGASPLFIDSEPARA